MANPLQCSCLENPREGGAWWAAVYGVAQSRTRLKRLSSSSNSINKCYNLHTNIGKFILKSYVDYRIQKNSHFKGWEKLKF